MANENHQILFYEYVEDVLDRRGPHRDAHLKGIEAARARGEVVMAGAIGDPPHGAVIVFRDVPFQQIEQFVHDDPYVKAGLVRDWRVERWTLV